MRRYCVLLVWLGLFASEGAFAERPAPERVREVVSRLGDEGFAEREVAQGRLAEWIGQWPRYLIVELAEAYGEAEDMEVRVRLREVLREPAILHLFHRPGGFIGIHMRPDTLDGVEVVRLSRVLDGLGGERAGLRAGDLVVGAAGKTAREIGGVEGFSRLVSAHPPGSNLPLVIQRDGKRFRVEVPLGVRTVGLQWMRERREEAEREFEAWLMNLGGGEEGSADFPVGHFPSE